MKKKLAAAFLIPAMLITLAFNEADPRYFAIVKNLDIFASLFKEVNKYYVDDVNPDKIIETGINAMLQSLDPYTNYIPEERIEDYRYMTTGEYAGIGATVGTRNGRVLILMPYEGFSAHRAGLQIGDEVVKVNDIDVRGKNTDQMSKLLKGQAGTEVSIEVERSGLAAPLRFEMRREKITVANVSYYGKVTDEIGLIKLTDFTSNAGREVENALRELKAEGAKKIILDLRGNPGGLLSEAINVSNVFVPRGSEIVSTKGKITEWNKTYKALNDCADPEIPLAVLISSGSASASEIVAGVMQDYDRGVLVGQNSYGKGLVQATRPLSYNSKLKVTVAKYYVPSGRCIQAIDYGHRNADGSVGKIADSLRSPFKTGNGREVFDGGGIKADIPTEAVKLSPIAQSLKNKGLIFSYASEYRVKNNKIADTKSFSLSDAEYNNFVSWLAGRDYDYVTGVERKLLEVETAAKEEKYFTAVKSRIDDLRKKIHHNKEADLQNFKEEIRELLEQEIASRYYLEKGITEATFDDDDEIREAVKVLSEPARYAKLLGQK